MISKEELLEYITQNGKSEITQKDMQIIFPEEPDNAINHSLYEFCTENQISTLRDERKQTVLFYAPLSNRNLITKKYHRDFLIDQGLGHKMVRWTAWRKGRENVTGYGMTEQQAVDNLVNDVQPL